MTIKVKHVQEEYRYLDAHSHRCGIFKKGIWKPVTRRLTLDLVEVITARCQSCGKEKVFRFDVSAAWSAESRRALEAVKDDLIRSGITHISGQKY
jgi:hypothetical protein